MIEAWEGLVALDAAWIHLGSSSGLELVSLVVWVVAALLTPIVFWRLWQRSLPGADGPRRWAAIAALTAICSLAWYYIAFTALVNVHLAMGGSL